MSKTEQLLDTIKSFEESNKASDEVNSINIVLISTLLLLCSSCIDILCKHNLVTVEIKELVDISKDLMKKLSDKKKIQLKLTEKAFKNRKNFY